MGPIMQVRRWSCPAASILQHQQVLVGWVHSCYARIVNLRTPTGRLLTLQGEEPLQAPLAVALAGQLEALVLRLPVGALVLQHTAGTVGIPAALRLVCTGAREWDGRIQPLPALTATTLCRSAEALTIWMAHHVPERGLAPLLAALHGRGHTRSAVHRRTSDALLPLLTGRHLSPTAVLEIAAQVVGLGEGLTPSGDDLLVGLLAVLHVTGQLEHALPPSVRQPFLQDVMASTSDLSAEFIRCALEGNFAEPVARLVRSLFAPEPPGWQGHAASLAAIGHSSGIDAMVGIVLGCRLLAHALEVPDGRLTFPVGRL